MEEIIDSWRNEDFEDAVDRGLISMYETKKVKNYAGPKNGINDKRLKKIRSKGVYIPGADRYIIATDGTTGVYDVKNDGYPKSGCIGVHGKIKDQTDDIYFHSFYFEKVRDLAKGWHAVNDGVKYEYYQLSGENNGVYGERSFFTITPDGIVSSCNFTMQARFNDDKGKPQGPISLSDREQHIMDEKSYWASVALQYYADKRFCWSIKAEESQAKITLGCMKEEVKSLLYARSLPMTSTGRKRPILHLVESHKRRLKKGIDIDITPFLRGIQKVEIGNTCFSVSAPKVIQPELSENSQKYYA